MLEVADSSVEFDREIKSRVYAAAGIVHYCMLNLRTREIEDYREPSMEGYRSKKTYRADESFALVAFPRRADQSFEIAAPGIKFGFVQPLEGFS